MELILLVVATPLAFWLGDSGVERALLIGSLILVLIVELLNSAVEAAVDRISFENHHLAKRAKDIGSAAVMLSLVNAAVVWLLIATA
jgi:diacylglycerol kinase (ATP)